MGRAKLKEMQEFIGADDVLGSPDLSLPEVVSGDADSEVATDTALASVVEDPSYLPEPDAVFRVRRSND